MQSKNREIDTIKNMRLSAFAALGMDALKESAAFVRCERSTPRPCAHIPEAGPRGMSHLPDPLHNASGNLPVWECPGNQHTASAIPEVWRVKTSPFCL